MDTPDGMGKLSASCLPGDFHRDNENYRSDPWLTT